MRLDVKAFTLTTGLLWGGGLFLATLWIVLLDGPSTDVTFLGRIYRGYDISVQGSLIGLAWGLADGAVGGAVFAWVYNRFVGGTAPA